MQHCLRTYLKLVEDFARHFHRPPDQLGREHIRAYQVYLLQERKLGVRTVALHTAALRFFFCKTLKRAYPVEEVPYPRAPRRLPVILTREEAVRMIDSASNLCHRAMLITMYSTGMRRAELCNLKVQDIDSTRMIIHIRQGKGGKDPDVPLSPRTLELYNAFNHRNYGIPEARINSPTFANEAGREEALITSCSAGSSWVFVISSESGSRVEPEKPGLLTSRW